MCDRQIVPVRERTIGNIIGFVYFSIIKANDDPDRILEPILVHLFNSKILNFGEVSSNKYSKRAESS